MEIDFLFFGNNKYLKTRKKFFLFYFKKNYMYIYYKIINCNLNSTKK